jgi:hypothetical protein
VGGRDGGREGGRERTPGDCSVQGLGFGA